MEREKGTCQNLAPFNSGYKKSDCEQVHVGKCFTLEDEAIGTVPIYLIHGSSKTHLRVSVSLESRFSQVFICLCCQSCCFCKTLSHSGASCSNPFLLSPVSSHFYAHFCDFCRKFGCIYLLFSEMTMK